MRLLWVVLLLVPFATPGCVCDTDPVVLRMTVAEADQEVRSLPILASGATRAAGIDVPDAHAMLSWRIDWAPVSVEAVRVDDFDLTVRIADQQRLGEVVHVEGTGHDDGTGDLVRGSTVTAWWRLDEDMQLALSEGATFDVELRMTWRIDDCIHRDSGTLRHDEDAFVRAAVQSNAFGKAGQPSVEGGSTGYRFDVRLQVNNGVDQRIDAGQAFLVATSTVPGIVAWPQVATEAGGIPSDRVRAGQELKVTEVAAAPMTPPVSDPEQRLFVLRLQHEAADGTAGNTQSVFGYLL